MSTVKISNKPLAIQMLRDAKSLIRANSFNEPISAVTNVQSWRRYERKYQNMGLITPDSPFSLTVTACKLREWINRSLDGCLTLHQWIEREQELILYRVGDQEYNDRMHAKYKRTSMAWIDWMISELEKLL